jgi:ubiquinone/menaquinone biosynthesis C-methylase UbiE
VTQSLRDVTDYYGRFAEEQRLETGEGQLERERTQDVLLRALPPAPARIVDVGGAAGVYSAWLAELGYEVHLVDATSRLVDEARRRNAGAKTPIASFAVGDARDLHLSDSFADVVMVMGPLYHLIDGAERGRALAEAWRVLTDGGLVVTAAISRFASALDGIRCRRAHDPAFVAMRDRDLADGVHINATKHPEYFTTSYFHKPDELQRELETAGFLDVNVVGVEGPGWLVADFDERWNDPPLRADMMAVARALESEPAMIGVSAHLIATGVKR